MTRDFTDRIRARASAELAELERKLEAEGERMAEQPHAAARRASAYADRAETRETCNHRSCVYEVGGRWSCEYPSIGTAPAFADGTGRHSRDRLQLADALTRIDQLTSELARREDRDACVDVVLDALSSLVRALPERLTYEFSPDSRRLLNALSDAQAVLAEAGR